MKHMQRVCQKCCKPFLGTDDRHYCLDCAKQIRAENVVMTRTCVDCGQTFEGGPRAKRCQKCRELAKKETVKRCKKNGTQRPLGSLDKCQWCGKQYIVNSGRQKYCSVACQRLAVLEWQRQQKKGYDKIPKIRAEKQRKRKNQKKICQYCLQVFQSDSPSSYCSNYCKQEQRKLSQCIADINRGYNRDLKKYEQLRDKYRKSRINNTIV